MPNNYDHYTISEEIINSLLHVIGIYIGLVFCTLICQKTLNADPFSIPHFASALIYGISAIMMFTMSSAYHCIQYIPAKKILKLLDHISIYFAIAGMNTPVCMRLIEFNSDLGYALLSFQWGAVVLGTLFKLKYVGRYKNISTAIYLLIGWTLVPAIKPIFGTFDHTQILYLVWSGVLYTIGSIFYSIKSVKYFHCIWHLFVLIASILHFSFIYTIV